MEENLRLRQIIAEQQEQMRIIIAQQQQLLAVTAAASMAGSTVVSAAAAPVQAQQPEPPRPAKQQLLQQQPAAAQLAPQAPQRLARPERAHAPNDGASCDVQGQAPGASSADSPLLTAVLDLAFSTGLCTAHQKAMVLDYVRRGRFEAAYYVDLWSSRLKANSPEALPELERLLVSGPPLEPPRRTGAAAQAPSVRSAAAPAVPAPLAAAVVPGRPYSAPLQRSPIKMEPILDREAPAEPDEWADVPSTLMRKATRTFEQEAALERGRARPLAQGPGLVEVSAPSGAAGAGAGAAATSSAAPGAMSLVLREEVHASLRPYQLSGVLWMWGLYKAKHGGVLADEMGLGKTVQACAFLSGIHRVGARRAMVVVPVTLLEQWATEAGRWCPEWPVHTYHGTAVQRSCAIRGVMGPQGGLLLTSYSILKNDTQLMQVRLAAEDLAEPVAPTRPDWLAKKPRLEAAGMDADDGDPAVLEKPWDAVICDEAHVMRNISTLLGRRLRDVRARCRLLLTGTPVQNALQDLWSLMDFAQPGLLGNHATFVKRFSDPIDQGSVRGASTAAVALKRHLCDQLWKLIEPHLIRRTKDSVGLAGDPAQQPSSSSSSGPPASGKALLLSKGAARDSKALPPKVETVIWLQPTKEQVSAYRKLLEKSELVKEANSKAKLGLEVFRAIGLLKRLCNHPALGLPLTLPGAWADFMQEASGGRQSAVAKRKAKAAAEAAAAAEEAAAAEAPDGEADEGARAGREVEAMLRKLPRDKDALVAQSAKLRCLSVLLPALLARGHRTLIFSQGVRMMDLVELCIMKVQGLKYLRIDGQTDANARAERVRAFQEEPEKYQFMLLTTSVGGYGLNLTSASRVVLLDPAWNPATDMQAVDRAHRIGQTREVRTYRLVMSGLIEDKMFRLQVFKMGITKTALEGKQQHRYFTANEIRGLFEWTDPAQGETRKLILEKHGKAPDELAKRQARDDGAHEGWLDAGPVLALSNFSQLYSSLAEEDEEAEEEEDPELRAMKRKLEQAEQEVQQATEARQAAEERVRAAQQEVEGFAAQSGGAGGAAGERGRAAEAAKQAQAQLTQAKRHELAAEQRLERAARGQAAALEQKAAAEAGRAVVEQLAQASQREVAQARASVAAAEEAVRRCLVSVEGTLALVNLDGTPAPGSPVAAAPAQRRAAQKAVEKASKAFEAVQAALAAWGAAADDAVRADAAAARAEGGDGAATQKGAEKERLKAETALGKAKDRADAARDAASQAAASAAECGAGLADSFCKPPAGGTLVAQVKSTQQAAKASFRQLAAAWQTCRSAGDSWAKALGGYRKAALKLAAADAACQQALDRFGAADGEHKEALAAREARAAERRACEGGIERAKQECTAADAREGGQKRKRAELKAELDAAKQALRPARAAEREAAASRAALYRHYARKADGGQLQAELAAARESAQEALSAMQALRDEEYDANQVEEAYQAKKKQRHDAE